MLRINSQSLEYIKVPVTAKKGGVAYDPTGDTVEMTFSQSETLPATPTWYAASWEDGSNQDMVRCLIGPTGEVELTASHTPWYVFIKITDNPEIPVLEAGPIEVY
ncbi:MAG TPA: hypothetical protein VMW94_01035 [Actinomycetes bacterium]|nr:hypothetical protein [Actinomycetes bacterium]